MQNLNVFYKFRKTLQFVPIKYIKMTESHILKFNSTERKKVKSLSHVQLFFNPMDCSLPGSSVHGILQARILEWAAISFSMGSSRPRDQTCISCITGRFFTTEPPGKPSSEGARSLFSTTDMDHSYWPVIGMIQ